MAWPGWPYNRPGYSSLRASCALLDVANLVLPIATDYFVDHQHVTFTGFPTWSDSPAVLFDTHLITFTSPDFAAANSPGRQLSRACLRHDLNLVVNLTGSLC